MTKIIKVNGCEECSMCIEAWGGKVNCRLLRGDIRHIDFEKDCPLEDEGKGSHEIVFFKNKKGDNFIICDRVLTDEELSGAIEPIGGIERVSINREAYELIDRMHNITCSHGFYFEKLTEILKDENKEGDDFYYYDGEKIMVLKQDSVGTVWDGDIKFFINKYEKVKNKQVSNMMKEFIKVAKELKGGE